MLNGKKTAFSMSPRSSLDNPDWWCIATIWALTFERHMWIFLTNELIWIWYFGCCCGECTSFVLYLYRTITPMMMMVATALLHVMFQFDIGTVGTASETWIIASLLIVIAYAALLHMDLELVGNFSVIAVMCHELVKSTHRCRRRYHIS